MKKNLFYWILFIVVSIFLSFMKYRYSNDYCSADFLHPAVVVEYGDYEKEKDFNDLDNLIEKYKFWLFHGDFKKGECPLYPDFESKMHTNDFDAKRKVPYYMKVAKVDGHCVGFITYYISENIIKKENELNKLGRIHLVCVDEKYRRLGIAKKLIQECIDFFKINNCQRAYLVTRPENVRAKTLYYKFGFNESDKGNNGIDVFDTDPAVILIKDL